jgi:hypothetical protein
MTKKANVAVTSGLSLSMKRDGASLSVTFHVQKFPDLFGWAAYTSPGARSQPQWEFVESEDPNVRYPRFTERNGHFAPYVRAKVEPRPHLERGADGKDTYVDGVVVFFQDGSPYNKRLTILI